MSIQVADLRRFEQSPVEIDKLGDESPLRNGDWIRMRYDLDRRRSIYDVQNIRRKLEEDGRWRVDRIDETHRGRSILGYWLPKIRAERRARGEGTATRHLPAPDGFDVYVEVIRNPFPVLVLVLVAGAALVAISVYATVREVGKVKVAQATAQAEESRTERVGEIAQLDRERITQGLPPIGDQVLEEIARASEPAAPVKPESPLGMLATVGGMAVVAVIALIVLARGGARA